MLILRLILDLQKLIISPGHCRGQDVQPDFHRPGRPEAAAAQEDHREGARGIRNQVCISHRSRGAVNMYLHCIA